MRLRLFRAASVLALAAVPGFAHAARKPLPPAVDATGAPIDPISAAEVVIDLYPATDSILTSAPKLSWHATERAKRYRVQLAGDGDFRSVVLDRTTTDLSVAAGSLRPGRYFWRVQAVDAVGVASAWSTTNDFEMRFPGELGKATLHWRPPPFGALKFVVRIAHDPKLTSIVAEKTTENAFLVTDPLQHGKYYWRVDSLDETGAKVESTPVKAFTVGEGGVVSYEGGT